MKSKKAFTLVELLVVISIIAILLSILMPSLAKAREIAKRMVCGNQIKQMGVAMAGYAMEYNDKMPWSGGVKDGMPSDLVDESTPHPWLIYRTGGHAGYGQSTDLQYQNASQKCVCGASGKPIAMRIACLFAAKLIQDGKVFYCPANVAADRRYDTYTKSDYGNAWATPHQLFNKPPAPNDWIRSGYDYYPIDRDIKNKPPYAGMNRISDLYVPIATCKKFTKLSTGVPYLSDTIWSKDLVIHKSGKSVDSAGVTILKSPSINCLFSDGHVRSVQDIDVISPTTGKKQKLFNNDVWDKWRVPGSDDSAASGIKASYLMYGIYSIIK